MFGECFAIAISFYGSYLRTLFQSVMRKANSNGLPLRHQQPLTDERQKTKENTYCRPPPKAMQCSSAEKEWMKNKRATPKEEKPKAVIVTYDYERRRIRPRPVQRASRFCVSDVTIHYQMRVVRQKYNILYVGFCPNGGIS